MDSDRKKHFSVTKGNLSGCPFPLSVGGSGIEKNLQKVCV